MSNVRSKPGTKDFRRHFDKAMGNGSAMEGERQVFVHVCEWCGKLMHYADQSCGCTAKRPLS